MNRSICADADSLAAEKAAAPAALSAAVAAYDAAIAAADLIENETQKRVLKDVAEADFREQQEAYTRAVRGVVINDNITAAILLMLGHLYENRAEESSVGKFTSLTMGAQALLDPYRIGMGV